MDLFTVIQSFWNGIVLLFVGMIRLSFQLYMVLVLVLRSAVLVLVQGLGHAKRSFVYISASLVDVRHCSAAAR